MNALIFIDTNILLDFYRVRGGDASLSILERFDQHHDQIITSSQVEMEYKKNRQLVIVSALKSIKKPDFGSLEAPAFLHQSQPLQALKKAKKQAHDQATKLKARTAKLLNDPGRNDPVYQVLQRLFKANGEYHLTRDKTSRRQIRRLAQKRFFLGYPPRKNTDTSYGDAINWEWIVECANSSGQDVIIVSRDSDYGVIYEDHAVLNDWLCQEFKERVSRKRKILMTTRLTEAFKQASIQVTAEEEKTEDELIKAWKPFQFEIPRPVFPKIEPPEFPRINVEELMREALANINRGTGENGGDSTEAQQAD